MLAFHSVLAMLKDKTLITTEGSGITDFVFTDKNCIVLNRQSGGRDKDLTLVAEPTMRRGEDLNQAEHRKIKSLSTRFNIRKQDYLNQNHRKT